MPLSRMIGAQALDSLRAKARNCSGVPSCRRRRDTMAYVSTALGLVAAGLGEPSALSG